ncbi:MAG: class I SAM-dependent methyltransferase [Planctomycetota bacterium]|jgi:SAM-dependent methyltransferase
MTPPRKEDPPTPTGLPPSFYGKAYFIGPGKDLSRESGYRDYRRVTVRLRQAGLALALAALFEFRTVLDAGCAFGYLVDAMGRLGKRAEGIEISEFAVANALPSVRDRLRCGNVLDLPYPDESFDLVVCQEVLEHLPPASVAPACEELKRVGKGVIFLTVPVADWATGRVPADRLPRDRSGRVHHGHLTVADRPWWESSLTKAFSPWVPADLLPYLTPRPDQAVCSFHKPGKILRQVPIPSRWGIRGIFHLLFE